MLFFTIFLGVTLALLFNQFVTPRVLAYAHTNNTPAFRYWSFIWFLRVVLIALLVSLPILTKDSVWGDILGWVEIGAIALVAFKTKSWKTEKGAEIVQTLFKIFILTAFIAGFIQVVLEGLLR